MAIKVREPPLGLLQTTNRRQKEAIDRLLLEHAPEVGSSLVAPAEAGESDAKLRVRDGGALLVFSGFMHATAGLVFTPMIVFTLARHTDAKFVEVWGASKAVMATLLIPFALSALFGVIVSVAGVKMRKLANYRFCCLGSVLAMLPVGPGSCWDCRWAFGRCSS